MVRVISGMMNSAENILRVSCERTSDIHISQQIREFNQTIKKFEEEYYTRDTASDAMVGNI